MEFIKLGTRNIGIAVFLISVCLLLVIGSFTVNTTMQALAQPPDHLYTPHTGIVHQIPERITLVPLQPQK
jgi:hypothetical protein